MSARESGDRTVAKSITPQGRKTHAMGNPQDMKAHSGTYASFINLLKWSIPVIALIVAVVVILIS